LAAHTRQGYMVPWLPLPAKNYVISVATNSQGNRWHHKKIAIQLNIIQSYPM